MSPAKSLQTAQQYIDAHKASWRNDKHRHQWQSTITHYCLPIADVPVDQVSQGDILGILQPIWTTKSETASRLRGRIEKILDAAKAQALRQGENPARWRGHLELLLPRRQKLQRGHHPAMAYAEVPEFVARLRELGSVSARALEFIILTTARLGMVLRSVRNAEVHGLRWDEIDLSRQLWTVPSVRMKSGADFRIPLTKRCIEIVEEMQPLRQPFVFPGHRGGSPLSEMACEQLLRRLDAKPATVHGFRTSFRNWTAEMTQTPDWVAELSLAHVVGSAVERAYQRSDVLERRRILMTAWESFLSGGVTRVALA